MTKCYRETADHANADYNRLHYGLPSLLIVSGIFLSIEGTGCSYGISPIEGWKKESSKVRNTQNDNEKSCHFKSFTEKQRRLDLSTRLGENENVLGWNLADKNSLGIMDACK